VSASAISQGGGVFREPGLLCSIDGSRFEYEQRKSERSEDNLATWAAAWAPGPSDFLLPWWMAWVIIQIQMYNTYYISYKPVKQGMPVHTRHTLWLRHWHHTSISLSVIYI
jgi:hypothetical protein